MENEQYCRVRSVTESNMWKISQDDLKSTGVIVMQRKRYAQTLAKSGNAYIMILILLKNYTLSIHDFKLIGIKEATPRRFLQEMDKRKLGQEKTNC